jgi:hypothetical protein
MCAVGQPGETLCSGGGVMGESMLDGIASLRSQWAWTMVRRSGSTPSRGSDDGRIRETRRLSEFGGEGGVNGRWAAVK